jgi:vacuolar-type H+-ATPase subunit I/STV1
MRTGREGYAPLPPTPSPLSLAATREFNIGRERDMKDLEERQREMRERNVAANTDEPVVVLIPRKQREQPSDVNALKRKIAELEKRVLTLEAENERLRAQKTIVVERPAQECYEDSVRKQRHNFFKYSNVRRY